MTDYDKAQAARNLDPHKAAKLAMWFWGETYAPQAGGSMDFWDSLTDIQRDVCRRAVAEIMAARDELPQEQTR